MSDTASAESSVLDSETANALQSPSTGRAVARATLGIAPLHLLRFLIGFAVQPMIARITGLSWQADAYAVATDVVQNRLWMIFEKVVNPAFLPVFARSMGEEGEERAWKFASTAIWLTALALLLVTPLAWWGMPAIINVYTPLKPHLSAAQLHDFYEERKLTVSIARLLLVGLFFLGMSSLTYVILNAYKRFVVAALGDVLWKGGIFAGAILTYLRFGGELKKLLAQTQTPAVSTRLAEITAQSLMIVTVCFVIGAFLKLLPQVLALGGKWRLLRPRIDLSDPMVRRMFAIAVPLILGILVSESRGIYLMRLANEVTDVAGARAAIKWSRTIGDSLIQVFPYALSIGIFPYLADLARRREDRQALTDALMGALRICAWVFLPVTAILIALRFPLLRAVWESGRFSRQDTQDITAPFVGYSVGLIAFSCEMMLNQTFYAMTRAWTPTLIGIAATVLWVALATLGVHVGWGLAAIAIAESVGKGVKCLIMWLMLRPQLGDVKGRENFVFLGKVLLGALLAALVAHFASHLLVPSSAGKARGLLGVAVSGALAASVYFAWSAWSGVREARQLMAFAGRVRSRTARG